jgi:hypothetical protein
MSKRRHDRKYRQPDPRAITAKRLVIHMEDGTYKTTYGALLAAIITAPNEDYAKVMAAMGRAGGVPMGGLSCAEYVAVVREWHDKGYLSLDDDGRMAHFSRPVLDGLGRVVDRVRLTQPEAVRLVDEFVREEADELVREIEQGG